MGKVVKYTGSRALAAELRRLRGTRTLDEISALTRSGPLAGRIKPVSPASLCQTEKAQNMPTLETLHALANLGMLRSAQRRWVEAEKALRQAEPLALELEEIDAAFAINFELHQVAVGAGAPTSKRRHYLERCQRYHPLVSRRSLSVQRYEELVGGAS